MAEDICFEFLIEVFCWIIIAALWEIGIQILMSMGMSYSGAEGLLIIIGIFAFFLAAYLDKSPPGSCCAVLAVRYLRRAVYGGTA